MEKIISYKCEYCGKLSEFSSDMNVHEIHCEYNPVNRCCLSCKYGVITSNRYMCWLLKESRKTAADDLMLVYDKHMHTVYGCPNFEKE